MSKNATPLVVFISWQFQVLGVRTTGSEAWFAMASVLSITLNTVSSFSITLDLLPLSTEKEFIRQEPYNT